MSGSIGGSGRVYGRSYRESDTRRRNSVAGTTRRCDRYLQLRKQRRQGWVWAIVAAVILTAAWDLTCRVDEVSYNEVSLVKFSETPYEAPHRIGF